MDSVEVADIEITLPSLIRDKLEAISTLASDVPLRGFQLDGLDLRTLDFLDMSEGEIRSLTLEHAVGREIQLHSIVIEQSRLADCRLDEVTLNRVVARDSEFLGARWSEVKLNNVIFEKCRFDYASLSQVTTTGPVAFVDCSLVEVAFDRCSLRGCVFMNCRMTGAEFGTGAYAGCMFIGSALNEARGLVNLRGAKIDASQAHDVSVAIMDELDIRLASP